MKLYWDFSSVENSLTERRISVECFSSCSFCVETLLEDIHKHPIE